MERLNASTAIDEQKKLIESICTSFRARMVEKGFISADETEDWGQAAISTQLERLKTELAKTSSF
jgi:hypothetical protein